MAEYHSRYYDKKYFLVFVIPSYPKNTEQRNAIRSTWMQVSRWDVLDKLDEEFYKRIKVIFIFGQMPSGQAFSAGFIEEQSLNNDMIVVEDITEGQFSLRPKVIWALKHSFDNFDFDFLVKTDDDILVNLPLLLLDLMTLPRGRVYCGRCLSKVGRAPQQWLYCSGGGYVLSRDLVGDILSLPGSVYQPRLPHEDILAGWLVWNVHNATRHTVRATHVPQALSLVKYRCGATNFWFYHGYKYTPPLRLVRDFETVFSSGAVVEC